MKLFLIGDGELHNALKKQAELLGISDFVEFTGYIASPKEYLAQSDIYISASHREGLPLSVLEAMASGLPVIATDVGGVRDLAQKNGILIADDDEDALYAAMKKLYYNKELRDEMGKKSLEMVQDFSASGMTAKYCELFDEFAKKPAACFTST
jgi:glycosyltransferase involved in cell wall biosynthesis